MPEKSSVSCLLELDKEMDALFPLTYPWSVCFDELNLPEELINGLTCMKFEKPTKLQSKSLPYILTPPYKNLYAHAYCGSGKSSCFMMGMLSRIDPTLSAAQALCICPTNYVAKQNKEFCLKMVVCTDYTTYEPSTKRSPVTPEVIFGKAQVIFGTAGTVKRLIADKKLDTSCLKMLMFDDADEMLIEGDSEEDSVWIMKDIHKQECKVQVLLCASIFNDRVKKFVDKIRDDLKLEEWTQLFVMKDGPALDLVTEYKVDVPDLSQYELIFKLKIIDKIKIDFIIHKILELGNYEQKIIFVHTQESARMLHDELHKAGYEVTNVHGALSEEQKDSILKEFECALTQILITTDVHARGFDPKWVNCVINYDLPPASGSTDDDYELYFHRIGRIGLHDKRGAVFNFMCGAADKNLMEKIEKYNKNEIVEVPRDISDDGFEKILAGRRLHVL